MQNVIRCNAVGEQERGLLRTKALASESDSDSEAPELPCHLTPGTPSQERTVPTDSSGHCIKDARSTSNGSSATGDKENSGHDTSRPSFMSSDSDSSALSTEDNDLIGLWREACGHRDVFGRQHGDALEQMRFFAEVRCQSQQRRA